MKNISLSECKNISFKKNIFLKLKSLSLNKSYINKPKLLLECPELEKCSFIFFDPYYYKNDINKPIKYNEIF
jgi:hypothetical protein